MNALTSSPFLLLLIATTALTAIGISHHWLTTRKKTRELLARLEHQVRDLRLSKMLDRLGIPRKGYFKHMTPEIIERHIHNCKQCTRSQNVHICDAHLDRGKHVKSMRFCPNYLSLIANSRVFYSRSKDKP